ncbi:MAG: RluA family pseudouridine synthase [Candidatus Eisenbacteria sp.]|nr:RluA family pseudouridine synthase [Candidatus Eisenbacteria bacterium]
MNDLENVERRILLVGEEGEGARIDLFVAEQVEGVSRSRVQRLIRAGSVLLDGQACKPSTVVREGQSVSWPISAGFIETRIEAEPIPLAVVFEDEDIAVLNKPPGLVVHPAPGHWHGTLVHGLLHKWPGWKAPGGVLRPGIVHRLDRDTSGLLVVARSARAYTSLSEQFAAHSTERCYVALVWGDMVGDSGEIDRPIGRDPRNRQRMAVVETGGRPARTGWEVLARFDYLTLLRIGLRTGRTHQVRVHMASLGHPVFGDSVYGGVQYHMRLAPRERPRLRRLLGKLGRFALHAYRLGFRHPADGEWLLFEAPVPEDMEAVLLQLTEPGGMA